MFIQTTQENLKNHWKNWNGHMTHPLRTDHKQTEQLKEQLEESKRGHHAQWNSQDFLQSGGQRQ